MKILARKLIFEDIHAISDFEDSEEYEQEAEFYEETVFGVWVMTEGKEMRLLDHSNTERYLLYLDDTYSDVTKEELTEEIMEMITDLLEEKVLFGDVDKVGYLKADKSTDKYFAVIRDAQDEDWDDCMTEEETLEQYGIYEGIDGILYDECGCPLPDQWE